MDIAISLATPEQRHPRPTDESKLGFGSIFTDHMFRVEYSSARGWHSARVEPYGPIVLDPASMVLHYGQEIFEGLKAYRTKDGVLQLFRPEANCERMKHSAERMCLPTLPVEDGVAALMALLRTDADWVPSTRGTSLYIRPTMIATEAGLGVRPAGECLFFIIAGPVGNYYARGLEPVRIRVEEKFVRAVRGGVGEAKTGGNYASSLLAAKKAKEGGFDQVLWLDGATQSQIEEVGTMNIFFLLGDELVTPALGGSILPGITRDCVLRIARDKGWNVSERAIGIDEIRKAAAGGSLREVFGTGTAAVISPVGTLSYKDETFVVNSEKIGPVAQLLFDEITGIQYGEIPDRFGWVRRVE